MKKLYIIRTHGKFSVVNQSPKLWRSHLRSTPVTQSVIIHALFIVVFVV